MVLLVRAIKPPLSSKQPEELADNSEFGRVPRRNGSREWGFASSSVIANRAARSALQKRPGSGDSILWAIRGQLIPAINTKSIGIAFRGLVNQLCPTVWDT